MTEITMSRKRRKARETRARDNAASDAFLYRKLPPSWRCLKCGAPMQRDISDMARASSAARNPGRYIDMVEVCGGCGAWHTRTGDALRLMSDAEQFATRVETPAAADASDEAVRIMGQSGDKIAAIVFSQPYRLRP
jgi:hypothetical protein